MRIQELSFAWNLFPDLTGLIEARGEACHCRFDLVRGHFGVLFFFDTSLRVQYVGLCGVDYAQNQSLPIRICQFFSLTDTGNDFMQNWEREQKNRNADFGQYIENLQLITLSTGERNDKLPEILKDIRRLFICTCESEYNETPDCNAPFRYLTSCEQNELLSEFRNRS